MVPNETPHAIVRVGRPTKRRNSPSSARSSASASWMNQPLERKDEPASAYPCSNRYAEVTGSIVFSAAALGVKAPPPWL